jgi:hypothetical protein
MSAYAGDLAGFGVHIIQRGSQYLFSACALVFLVSAKQLLECANAQLPFERAFAPVRPWQA